MALDLPSYLLGKKKGGGGGTSDYSQLTNKPSINGVTLSGNKTSSDLEIETIQYSTMPTASSSNVGQIVQYTGASISGSYQNGYFYICVNKSGTYSWENINVQDSGGLSLTINYNDTTANLMTALQPVVDQYILGNYYDIICYKDNQTFRLNYISYNPSNGILFLSGHNFTGGSISNEYGVSYENGYEINLWIYTNTSTHAITNVSKTYENGSLRLMYFASNTGKPLGTKNTTSFTPTSDYHPATKKYVDDNANPIVTTSSDSTYTIASLVGNQTYKLGEITSLTITATTTFDKESVIYFESGSTATSISIPDSITNLGDTPTFTTASNVNTGTCDANKKYIIAILNNIAVWKKY